MLLDSGYVLCPGLCASDYEDKQSDIRFQSSEVHIIHEPVVRYESHQCLLWHNPSNRRLNLLHKLYNMCSECKKVSSLSQFRIIYSLISICCVCACVSGSPTSPSNG